MDVVNTVNEYRTKLVGDIREVRRAMDKRRTEIEVAQGWDVAIMKGKIILKETKTRLKNLLEQRKNGIMGDDNLSSDAKEAIIKDEKQQYLKRIEEKEDAFKKMCEDIDRQVEMDDEFKKLRERLEEILSERDGEKYKKAEKAHLDQIRKFHKVKKLREQFNLADEDLVAIRDKYEEKKGNRQFIKQCLGYINDKELSLRRGIESGEMESKKTNSRLLKLRKRKNKLLRLLGAAKQEEDLAIEELEKEVEKYHAALSALSESLKDLKEQQRINEEVDIKSLSDSGAVTNEGIKGSDEIQRFTGSTGNEDLSENDRKILLEEIEKISSMRGPKIGKYVGFYERLGYIISDKSALIYQLTAPHQPRSSILGAIKNDLINRIQNPENNKPQEKKGRGGVFFFIDFPSHLVNGGIVLAADMKTILCAAPQSAYKSILTGETTNFHQIFNRGK